jgi:hypothetical protein
MSFYEPTGNETAAGLLVHPATEPSSVDAAPKSRRKKSTPVKRDESNDVLVDHNTVLPSQHLRPKRQMDPLNSVTRPVQKTKSKRTLQVASSSSKKKTSRKRKPSSKIKIPMGHCREPKLNIVQSITSKDEKFMGPVKAGDKKGEYFVYQLVDDIWDTDGEHYYRVRWWGWKPNDDTWELKEDLTDDLISQYREALKQERLEEDAP